MSQFVPVFDWYQGSLPEGAQIGAREVLGMLGDGPLEPIKPRNGYARAFAVRRDGSTLCEVFEGEGLRDHFKVSGADSPEVAEFVRSRLPGHSVARADVAVDFLAGPDFFDSTRDLLKSRFAGTVLLRDWIENDPRRGDSATLYIGADSAEVRARLYQSGRLRPETCHPDEVRFELQVSPQKPARKLYACSVEPLGLFGMGRWSREALRMLTDLEAPAAPARSARVSDLDRAMDTLASQYGKRLMEQVARFDGDMGAAMSDVLARMPAEAL